MNVVIRPIKSTDYRDVKKYLFIQSSKEEIEKHINNDLKMTKKGMVLKCLENFLKA